ncbi:MAG: hypothetical protein M1820_006362 [Bogoriella megaspora]|nr:MAG: hypothetical protein M1820_006362 [Bogoriella megaspora]
MSSLSPLLAKHRPDLHPYETLYKHFHSHPELSHQEKETATTIHRELSKLADFSLHPNIGGHGLAAVLKNGPGKTVLLRADMDGLPVEEQTGLPYASKARMRDRDGVEKPVMHACGHDMHITSLLAAAELLHRAREEWSGTLLLIFQPAEERGEGAKRMVDEGLYDQVPIPDIVLGGHVMPFRSGTLGTKKNLMATSADSMAITIYGRGGHASQPHMTIDPVVTAASTVLKLQTIVSREVAPDDQAVVTVGSIVAGDAENIISDRAVLKVDVRAIYPSTREKVLKSVERIVRAESDASTAPKPPDFKPTRHFPFMYNDPELVDKLDVHYASHFTESPQAFIRDCPRLGGSEDFAILGTEVDRPCCFWVYGGTDPEKWDKAEKEDRLGQDIPINHSAFFAPVIQPTLKVSVDAYAIGALTWLAKSSN